MQAKARVLSHLLCCKQLLALIMDGVFLPDVSASGLSLVCELHSPRVRPSQRPLAILRFTWMSLGLDSVFFVLECFPWLYLFDVISTQKEFPHIPCEV